VNFVSKLFRDELQLAIDLFRKPSQLTDLEALAQTIQNLILIDPGTYPSDPLLGVGITNYLFELMDTVTLNEIQNKIDDQLTKYILHESVTINTNISEVSTGSTKLNAILIKVELYSVDNDTKSEMSFVVSGNTTNKKTISKIIL